MDIFGIPVEIVKDEGSYSVTDCEVNMYGVGDTVAEAVEEYKSVVSEYLDNLERDKSILGKHLKQHLEYLRERMKI